MKTLSLTYDVLLVINILLFVRVFGDGVNSGQFTKFTSLKCEEVPMCATSSPSISLAVQSPGQCTVEGQSKRRLPQSYVGVNYRQQEQENVCEMFSINPTSFEYNVQGCQYIQKESPTAVQCWVIKKCKTDNGGCDANAACTFEQGFTTTCTCYGGFTGNGTVCTDINECLPENGVCCKNAACINLPGSYQCDCGAGYWCTANADTNYISTCADYNECADQYYSNKCSPNAVCINSPGSWTCACAVGYTGNGFTCADINECLTNNGGCSKNANCTNSPGSFGCACVVGYTGNGFSCTDINECLTNNGGCSTNASCTNNPGSFGCACVAGYNGNGFSCTDINECLTNNGGCSTNANCTNSPGSFGCACVVGYTGNGFSCTDVNECLTNKGGCSTNAVCNNAPGSFACACVTGYTGNGFNCYDINECLTNNGGCNSNAQCNNTIGSFTCACLNAYFGNGFTCTRVSMDMVVATIYETQMVSCDAGYQLLSCGVNNSHTTNYDFNRHAIPSNSTACQCYDYFGIKCVVWCTNAVSGFEIITSPASTGNFSVSCPVGKQVLGCGVRPTVPQNSSDNFRQHYPSPDGNGCTCQDSLGAWCVASCAANIRNHEVVSTYGNGTFTVSCPAGKFVLGCGMGAMSATWERFATNHITSLVANSCTCYRGYGATCYATCGLFN